MASPFMGSAVMNGSSPVAIAATAGAAVETAAEMTVGAPAAGSNATCDPPATPKRAVAPPSSGTAVGQFAAAAGSSRRARAPAVKRALAVSEVVRAVLVALEIEDSHAEARLASEGITTLGDLLLLSDNQMKDLDLNMGARNRLSRWQQAQKRG
jgi:hypothetical protein